MCLRKREEKGYFAASSHTNAAQVLRETCRLHCDPSFDLPCHLMVAPHGRLNMNIHGTIGMEIAHNLHHLPPRLGHQAVRSRFFALRFSYRPLRVPCQVNVHLEIKLNIIGHMR
jgi:hypothetical protein